MIEYLTLAVVIPLLLLGLLMVFFPNTLHRVELALNRPVGQRAVITLRAGIPAEKEIEEILNRPVLMRAVYWDQWIRRRPRVAGVLLLAAATLCLVAVIR
jgi:hypothetical protein